MPAIFNLSVVNIRPQVTHKDLPDKTFTLLSLVLTEPFMTAILEDNSAPEKRIVSCVTCLTLLPLSADDVHAFDALATTAIKAFRNTLRDISFLLRSGIIDATVTTRLIAFPEPGGSQAIDVLLTQHLHAASCMELLRPTLHAEDTSSEAREAMTATLNYAKTLPTPNTPPTPAQHSGFRVIRFDEDGAHDDGIASPEEIEAILRNNGIPN